MDKKKSVLLLTGTILIIFLMSLVIALSDDERDCRNDCTLDRRSDIKTCNSDYKEERISCRQEKKSCKAEIRQEYYDCKEDCNLLERNEKRICRRECAFDRIEKNKDCSSSECLYDSREGRKTCIQEAKNNHSSCKDACLVSRILIEESDCESAGGLYMQVCNGPYFDIICSPIKYCLCEGDGGYRCPEDYSCEHDIMNLLPRKQHTIEGYKDLLGNDLGDIGVCESS